MVETDEEQNRRIRDVESRINELENGFSAITAKLELLEKLSRGLIVLAGFALGVDIVPLMGGA
jgi:hypothetical protein